MISLRKEVFVRQAFQGHFCTRRHAHKQNFINHQFIASFSIFQLAEKMNDPNTRIRKALEKAL